MFNNLFFKHLGSLARPHGAEDRTALPIAVDAGSLADSWRQEPGTPVYGTPYGPFADEVGTPGPAAKIHAALVGAHR